MKIDMSAYQSISLPGGVAVVPPGGTVVAVVAPAAGDAVDPPGAAVDAPGAGARVDPAGVVEPAADVVPGAVVGPEVAGVAVGGTAGGCRR